MADQEITPEARQIVAAAFAYAGPVGGREGEWRGRLNEGVLRAAAAMNGRVAWDAQAMLDAFIFSGIYGGFEIEESSTRMIVKVASDTGRDKDKDAEGFERIRTDRTDTMSGQKMRDRLQGLPIGSKILAWKVMEKMASSEDDAKVRIMKHFEVLQINKDSGSSGTPPTAAPPRSAGAETVAAPADTNSTDDAVNQNIAEQMRQLNNKQKVAVAKRCRVEGIEGFMTPKPEDLDKVLMIIQEESKK